MATTTAEQALEAAVRGVFHRWTALGMILEMHDDPRRARTTALEMADTVRNMAARGEDINAIVEMMYNRFDEINVDMEDGSIEQVAEKILDARNAAARGDFRPASLLAAAPAHRQAALSSSIEGKGEKSGGAGNDDSLATRIERQPRARAPAPIDDDGFTSVVRR